MTDQNYYPAEQYHSLAIVSLIFGILGLTQLLPVVGPIGAIIAGKMAQKEIRDRPDLYKGDNLARAGVLTGWIGIGSKSPAIRKSGPPPPRRRGPRRTAAGFVT